MRTERLNLLHEDFPDLMRLVFAASACGGRLIGNAAHNNAIQFCFDGMDILCARSFAATARYMDHQATMQKRWQNVIGVGHRDYVVVWFYSHREFNGDTGTK